MNQKGVYISKEYNKLMISSSDIDKIKIAKTYLIHCIKWLVQTTLIIN